MKLVTAVVSMVLLSAFAVSAAPIVYDDHLNGPFEFPPNSSPGTGFALVTIDVVAHTLQVHVPFGGLLGTTTASHIHAPTAAPGAGMVGVATITPTFTGFPLGLTSGTYDRTYDTSLASAWNPAYVTANGGTPSGGESALASALAGGKAYLNIHTNVFPGGEIRGFLQLTPEPGTLACLGAGLGLMLGFRRRRTA